MREQSSTARFWQHVEKTDTCWLWTGSHFRTGYGQARHEGKNRSAHRVAWELTHGPIPDGVWVLHRCDVKHCVNPGHLFLGTATDNARDRQAKGRSKDDRGERHPMARLTEGQVREIRQRRAEGWVFTRIAAAFGICPMQAYRIVARKRWQHVE